MSITTDAQPSPEASARQAGAQDQADMEQLIAGRDAALNDLMERHATPLFHFLCRMVGNEERRQRPGAGNLRPRLPRPRQFPDQRKIFHLALHIAANLARNHFRWRSRHPNVSLEAETGEAEQTLGSTLPATDPAPNEQALTAERAKAVRTAVSKLPEDLREAIVLCEWEDRSIAEAAAILESTPKAVESRLYRARQILRERLKQWL